MPKKVSSSLRHRLLRPVHKIKKKVNHSTRISSHYFGRHRKQSEQNVNSWAGHLIYFPLRLFPPSDFSFLKQDGRPGELILVQNLSRKSQWPCRTPCYHCMSFVLLFSYRQHGPVYPSVSIPVRNPHLDKRELFCFLFFFFSFLQILTYTKRDCLGNGPSSSSCGRSQIEKWDKTSVAFAVISRAMRSLPK